MQAHCSTHFIVSALNTGHEILIVCLSVVALVFYATWELATCGVVCTWLLNLCTNLHLSCILRHSMFLFSYSFASAEFSQTPPTKCKTYSCKLVLGFLLDCHKFGVIVLSSVCRSLLAATFILAWKSHHSVLVVLLILLLFLLLPQISSFFTGYKFWDSAMKFGKFVVLWEKWRACAFGKDWNYSCRPLPPMEIHWKII